MRPSRAELVVLGLLLVSAHGARGQAIGQGFELERAGQYQRAATVYFTTLRGEPTNLAALLGLERVLPSLSRLPELLPAAQRAVAASPGNAALRAVLLRTYVALNEPDSARAVAQRWTAEQPRAEAPYREWRSEEHTSELQSQSNLVCRLLLEKKKRVSSTNRSP